MDEFSEGFGDVDEEPGVDEPKDGVVGRGGVGGEAGRGGWWPIGGDAGFGAIGGGEGRGAIGAGDVAGVVAAGFGAALRAAFLRAGLAFLAAALRFAAGRPRRFAAARLPFFALLPARAAAERRFVADFAFARAPFLRPRFDFDLDPVRAITPPVIGMNSPVVALATSR